MDDRIGQRLLRLIGLEPPEAKLDPKLELKVDPKLEGAKVDSEAHHGKGLLADTPPEVPQERPHRISEETTVERYQENPFLAEEKWSPPETEPGRMLEDEANATQLADEQVVHEEHRADEVTEKTEAHVDEKESDVDDAREPDRQQDQEQSEQDGRGAGWVREEARREEAEDSKGLRQVTALGDEHRCHGISADGARCLRKPIEGKAYCREHEATRASSR